MIKEAPDAVRPALDCFDKYHKGILALREFRWEVFQHIRSDNLTLLHDQLRRLFDSNEDADPITAMLQDCMDDRDWPVPAWARHQSVSVEEVEDRWRKHRQGMAAVRDYLARRQQRDQ